MKNQKILPAILVLMFAGLMSIPYIVPHLGFTVLFAMVPLLCMERIATMSGMKKVWLWHYSAFVLWNAVTTFWVGNATIGGGLFAIFANALQMSVIFGLFRFSRRAYHGSLPYIFLMVAWIAWEHAYFNAQISWPWLVLGNSLAGTVSLCQWYEYLGTIGGSLWIWLCNLGLFGIMTCLSDGSWNRFNIKAKCAVAGLYIAVLFVPMAISAAIYHNYKESDNPLEVMIVQPNIDPYNKFEALSQSEQTDILLSLAESSITGKDTMQTASPLLIVAPETFTNDVLMLPKSEAEDSRTVRSFDMGSSILTSRTIERFNEFLSAYPNASILFGASTYEKTFSKNSPDPNARKIRWRDDIHQYEWITSHNSALLTDGHDSPQIFHKSKLVVGVEMTPYPEFFTRIDDMLGGVMGRCVGQKEISTLCVKVPGFDGNETRDIRIGTPVCYESIYGDYCRGYIHHGAQALAVITNDAWWGNTPGYRQHLRYASLRAIETRRDIARCANTGISAIINQRGDIVRKSGWWKPDVIRDNINLNDKVTVFVSHGDVVGRLCGFLFWFLFLGMVARAITAGRRTSRKS